MLAIITSIASTNKMLLGPVLLLSEWFSVVGITLQPVCMLVCRTVNVNVSGLAAVLHPLHVLVRAVYTSVMSDMTFTSCVLDLAYAMLLAAGGPLWEQFQRTDISTAQR